MKRIKNKNEMAIYLLMEVMFWSGIALVVFGSTAFQWVGGMLLLVSTAAMIWAGLIRKSIWVCKACGTEIMQ